MREPKAPWWQPYQEAHDRLPDPDPELEAEHELAFALEARSWFRGGAHV
ncbi:hypothetical protein ACIBQ0_16945 [Nocardia nova]|nr:hypothetical protein [Nocardia nova]